MRASITLLLTTLALALASVAGPAPAVAKGNPLSVARKQTVVDFKQTTKEAEKTFNAAVANLTKGLSKGTTDAEAAATGFGAALGFYASSLVSAADDAATEGADTLSIVMAEAGDDDLDGAQGGDGGQLDGLFADLQKELDRLRKRALKRSRKFTKTFAKKGGSFARMRVVLAAWTLDPRAVPTAGGADLVGERRLQFLGAVASRLNDSRVIVSAFGAADPTHSEQFDVRISGPQQLGIGEFVSDGGMPVGLDGRWLQTVDLGTGPAPGNRSVLLGTEPEDLGLAGLQPTRLVHAGTLSIP